MKTRILKENNYKGIYHNGKTLRIALDPKLPITDLSYPEFWDVKITSKCRGGCDYCYQSSSPKSKHFEDIVGKTLDFFQDMTKNQRPFQVALGGGNPNEHPDFIKLLETYNELGITPNYTTNGMGLTPEVLRATKEYCGGVAVSCHKHLEKTWRMAILKLTACDIKVNLHLIISDRQNINYFLKIYKEYKDSVAYFVLLPYEAMGRAKNKKIDYEYLTESLEKIKSDQIAFGANFYEYLKKEGKKLDVSLYEPEIMSKYLDMEDMSIHKSSFNL